MASPAPIRACPVCDGDRLRTRFQRWDSAVDECHDCGLRFLNPPPDDDALAAIYNDTYFLGGGEPEAQQRVTDLKRATARSYLAALGGLNGAAGKRLLEVGCGRGEFLLEARARGYDAFGVDYSKAAATVANQRLGDRRVSVGELQSAEYPPASFDALVMIDLIEHVRRPRDLVRRAAELLKPGGVLLLVTPSLDSWSSRCLGRWWMEYKLEHLYYFNERSLRRLLEPAGFADLRFQPNAKVLSLDYICEHFRRFRVPLLSLAVRGVRTLTPGPLAHRPFRIVASGVTVIARKAHD